MLATAIDYEEKAAPLIQEKTLICLREIKSLEMTEMDQKKMKQMLEALVSDAREHRRALEELIEKVKESPKHDF